MKTVSGIIRKRRHGSLAGSVIVIIVLVAAASSNTGGGNFMVLTIVGVVVLVPLLIIYGVNTINYPDPKPYYRTFNKVVYIWGSKLALVGSVIDFVANIKRAANPFDKLTEGAAAPSKATDLLNAAVDVGFGYQMYRQLKPAEAVEQYYASREQAVPAANPQPLVNASEPTVVSPETPSSDTIDSSKQ